MFNVGLNERLKMGENLRKPLQPVPKPALALVAELKFIARLMSFEAFSSFKCLSSRTQPAHRAILRSPARTVSTSRPSPEALVLWWLRPSEIVIKSPFRVLTELRIASQLIWVKVMTVSSLMLALILILAISSSPTPSSLVAVVMTSSSATRVAIPI